MRRLKSGNREFDYTLVCEARSRTNDGLQTGIRNREIGSLDVFSSIPFGKLGDESSGVLSGRLCLFSYFPVMWHDFSINHTSLMSLLLFLAMYISSDNVLFTRERATLGLSKLVHLQTSYLEFICTACGLRTRSAEYRIKLIQCLLTLAPCPSTLSSNLHFGILKG